MLVRNGSLVLLVILFLASVTELGLQSFYLNGLGVYVSPVVWLVSGVVIALSAGLLFFQKAKEAPDRVDRKSPFWLPVALFIGAAVFIGIRLSGIFLDYPVGPEHSDIVPSLQMYVQRMLGGETVYAPLEFPTWTVLPTYFPVMWLPYTFSEVLNIDYRWTAYGVFLLGAGLYLHRLYRQGAKPGELVWKTLLPFVYLLVFISTKPNYFGYAVELMPAGLYLLLALTVFKRNIWVMALGISLCLLSRYALSFWLPVYMIMLWGERSFPHAFKVGLGVLTFVALLYVIPFLSKDWSILTDGLAYYQKTAEGQWHPQTWQAEGEPPAHLYRGLSFAPYFYEKGHLSVVERLADNQKIHFLVSATTALLLLLGYFLLRRRSRFHPRLYALVALKLYLSVFYAWLYVPFAYLYMLPCLFTLVLWWEIRNHHFLKISVARSS